MRSSQRSAFKPQVTNSKPGGMLGESHRRNVSLVNIAANNILGTRQHDLQQAHSGSGLDSYMYGGSMGKGLSNMRKSHTRLEKEIYPSKPSFNESFSNIGATLSS